MRYRNAKRYTALLQSVVAKKAGVLKIQNVIFGFLLDFLTLREISGLKLFWVGITQEENIMLSRIFHEKTIRTKE